MPEVVRGSRPSVDFTRSHSNEAGGAPRRGVHFGLNESSTHDSDRPQLSHLDSGGSGRSRRKSTDGVPMLERRPTDKPADRPDADAYFDSRAATKKEFKRRASTLQEYYKEHPALLPQLPFTLHHGWRRWKLFFLIFLMFVDACVIPIVLYYTMKFVGEVQGYISMSSLLPPVTARISADMPSKSSQLWRQYGAVRHTLNSGFAPGV
jgi:hypothetical protein